MFTNAEGFGKKGVNCVNNVELFFDTQRRIKTNLLLSHTTKQAIQNTRIYDEDFQSEKHPHSLLNSISVQENTTLLAAKRYVPSRKRIAVLNFANPIEPGGGVMRGASAQEEYLCRASNLYPCLASENAESWYNYHRQQKEQAKDGFFLASDKIIYSSDVTVIRQDNNYVPLEIPAFQQKYSRDWYRIDVITAAAPCFRNTQQASQYQGLEELFIRRIENIFETAIEHNVQILILGAFGCGAFHNPPVTVAKAFHHVFSECRNKRYRYAFEAVCFAIMRNQVYSNNIEAFQRYFLSFPEITPITPESIRMRDALAE